MSAARKYIEAIPISLKLEPSINEKWIQELINRNPAILGLGDELQVIGNERRQVGGGRLDLLLRDPDTDKRYEVEIQLGRSDESHIIRTIEYWDLERKRDPHFDHCAVIIAEEITARFFNVISLFNGHIPLIAIKMTALQVGENLTVSFTKVLEENCRNIESEPEEYQELTRATWETNFSKEAILVVDRLAEKIQSSVGPFDFKYNKYYIGCVVNGRPANFIAFKPQKNALRLDLGIHLDQKQIAALEEVNIEVLPYTSHWKVHPVKLNREQALNPPQILLDIVNFAYKDYFEK